MKKRIVFALLALTVLFSLVACGEEASEKKTEAPATKNEEQVSDLDAATVLNNAWDKIAEDKKFPVRGGDFETPVDGKAGKINVKDVEYATANLHITEEDLGKVTDAADLVHMMNGNTFTCAAYRVKSADAKDLVSSLKDSIKGTQWMCGFPETLVIYTVKGEFVVAAFGNGEAIDSFEAGLTEAFGSDATLSVEEALA